MKKKNIFTLLSAALSSSILLISSVPIYMGKDTTDTKYDSFFYEDTDIYSNTRYSQYGSYDNGNGYQFYGYKGTQNLVTIGDPSVTDNRNPNFLNTNYFDRFTKRANWVDDKSLNGRRRKWKLIFHKDQPANFRENRYLGGFYFSQDMILADNSFVKFSFYPADINVIDYANVSTKEIPVSWTKLPTNKSDYTFINPLYSQNPYFEDKWQNIVNWVNPENTSTAGAAGYNNNSEIRLRGLWTNSAYPWTAEEQATAEKNGLTRDSRSNIANRLINDQVTTLGKGTPGFYHKSIKKINKFENGEVARQLINDGLYDEDLLNNEGIGFWNLLEKNAGYMFSFFIDAPNARNRGWSNNVVVVEFETVDNPNFKWNGNISVPTFLGGAYTLFDVGFNSGFEGESGFIIRSEKTKSSEYKFRIKETVNSSDTNIYLPKSIKRREDDEIDNKLYEVGLYYTNQNGTEIKLLDLDRTKYNNINNAREYYSEYTLNSPLNNIDPSTFKIKAKIKDTNFQNQWNIAEAKLASTTKDSQGFYVFNDLTYTPLITDRLRIEQMLQTDFPNLSGWVSELVQKFINNEFKDKGENSSESDVWFKDHNNTSTPDDKKYVYTFIKLLRFMIPTIQSASEVDEIYYSDTNKGLSSDENKLISQLNFAYSSTQNLKEMVVKLHEFLSSGKNALKNDQPLPQGQKAATEWGYKLNDILGRNHQTYDQEVAKLDGYKVANDNTISGKINDLATSEFSQNHPEAYQRLTQSEKDNLVKLFKEKAIDIINNQFKLTATNGGIDNLIETNSNTNLETLKQFQAEVADAILKRKYLNDYVTWINNNLKNDDGTWKETVSENTLSSHEDGEKYNKFIDAFDNAEYQKIFLNDPSKGFLTDHVKFNNFKTKLNNGLNLLTESLNALDGNKNQAKKAVESFVFVESNETERQEFAPLLERLQNNYESNNGAVKDAVWSTNNSKLAEQINKIFAKAKTNSIAKLNKLTNLTETDKTEFSRLINEAELNPISKKFTQFGNDANLKLIYDKAALIDHIRSLTNLTAKQKQALIDQINIADSNDSNYVNPKNYETFKTNATNLNTQMKALKDYYDKLPDSLKPNNNGEITDELYVYEKTQTEKENYKNYIKQTEAVIDDSATKTITNSTEIETLLRNLEDAKSKLDGSSSYLPRQNELKHMTVELKQQLLKEIDTTITNENDKENQFKKVQALDLAIGKELNKINQWQTNYVVDTNVGYKNAIESLKKDADSLTTKLTTAFNSNLADGNQNKDKFNQVEQEDPNNYSGLYTKAFANFKALKEELSNLKSKLDESNRLYNLAINHTNNNPELFATNVAKNYANDQSPFTVEINDNQPDAVIQNIQVVAANDVDGKLEITYEIVSTKAKLTDVKTKVQTYVFKADTQDNYQTEKQRLNTIANSINEDKSKISLNFTAANELANSETAKNKANYSYSNATNEELTFDITNINPESDFGRSTLNFTLTSTKSKEDLFWRQDNNLDNITYTVPKSDANSVTITGFKNGEKTRLDGLSGYSIDRSDKSKILASKVTIEDLDSSKWSWSPEIDGQYTFAEKRIVGYNDVTGQIKLGFKLQSTKPGLEKVKSEEKFVTISGFKTELDRINELIKDTWVVQIVDKKRGEEHSNKLPSELNSDDFTTKIADNLVNQNVTISPELYIYPNDTKGEAYVCFKIISARTDLISVNWEPVEENPKPIISKWSNYVLLTAYRTTKYKEVDRLNDINVTYTNKNAQLMPSEISAANINSALAVTLPENSEAEVVELAITDQDDRSGSLTISYKLRSTKENLTKAETAVKTYTFKSETKDKYKTEQERIDAISYQPTLSENVKLNKTASEIKPSDIVFVTSETDEAYEVKIVSNSINDKTGAFTVEYKIKSKRTSLDDIVSTQVKTATFNTLTESQRLDKVINDKTITKEITYAGQKAKNKVLASEVKKEMLSPNQALLSNSKAKIAITDVKVDPNNNQQVIVTYNLTSTKDNLSDVTSSVTKEITIGGFQSPIDREKEIIDAYTNDEFVGLGDATKLASAFNDASKHNDINLTFKTPDNHANERISITNVIGYNDVIGALKVQFKVISNKNGQDVVSEPKEIIINNYLTEKGRLNNLRQEMYNQNINVDYPQKSLSIPSKAVDDNDDLSNFYYTQSNENKAELINVSKESVDDAAGTVNIEAELRSTKTQAELISNWEVDPNVPFVTPVSDNTALGSISVSGFRTKAEQDKIDREAEKERLNNLTVTLDYDKKIATLPSDADIKKVIATIKETNPEARVVIDSIDTRHEIEGSIRIQYHLVSEKSDEIYQDVTSANKYAQIKGFKTEQMRLDEIIQNLAIEAGIKNIANDQYDKRTASQLLKDLILNKLATNKDTSYNLKVVDKSANDNTGEISYTWQIISNRGTVNSQNLNAVTSSKQYNKSGTLSGFKTLAQKEKERLDSIDFSDKAENGVLYRIDYPNKANEQASSLTNATTNWTWDTLNKDNYEFVNQKIVGYNDLTGEIRLSFQIRSTKPDFASVVSNTKEIIISGFETELQRLNKLIDANPYDISLNNTVNKETQKASTLNKDNFSASIKENADNTSDHSSDLLLTDANDNTGQIGVKYKLISNRQVNTDQTDLKKLVSNWKETFKEQQVISKESTPVNFAGFLTNTEEEKRRIEDFLPKIVLDFTNRDQYLPLYNKNDVIDSKVIVKLKNNETLEQNQIKVKENSLTITERDDREGYIKVSYTLQSTKPGLEGAEIVVNETRSANTNKLSGFKTELQRLEGLVFDFNNSVSDKNQKQASDTEITIGNLNKNDVKTTNITISNKTRDDRNGTLSGTYSIYSTRDGLNDIHVDDKEFTINGFLTEKERINNLLADDTIQSHVEYKLDNQAEILPSELLANKDEVLNNLSTYFDMNLDNEAINQVNLKIIELSADDTDGSITFKYKIASTKENLTDIESEQSKTITLSGFLTELDKHKKEAKKTINALQNISETQKDAAKAKVEEQNTIDNVNNIVTNTTAVDAALGTIKDIAPVKEKVQFKEADADKQNALTTALDNLNSLESKEDFQNAVENLQDKVQTLKDAHKALNGDSNLAKAKADAIAAIDKLSYLSKTQKDTAKSDINAKEAIVDVNNIVNNATLMNNAKEALDKASKAQKTIAYTKASEQPKANFDEAKADVEAIKDITNFNKPVDNIVDLTNNLNNATAALDGSENLDAAKEEALKELDKLSYLSDSEKFKASEAIKNATDGESLAKAIEDAKALNKAIYDKKVDELNDLTNQYLQSTYGTDASNKHRENVVKAINEFNSKAFSDTNGEAAIAKAQNLLDLVDSITTNKSRNNFEELADASDLANIDTLANAVIKHNYFETSTKAKKKLNSTDLKNIKQLVSKAGDIEGLNVLTTAITKGLKDNSPILIWPYFVAASVATWLLGMAIFIFGKKK
ncbi:lipoprotein 17-related variable surface protein [Mycoplasma sp. 21DD0573]|uniref:lipoprotein 17-related variable surface protein n=1 Tax=unclassified Mycoplasma TaxID=2683645 RepID=UPI002B1D6B89|nr:lipoprotein 17-related variable surface protein [Mycoplasma sp. 21DD0573]MEA4276151.1 lipoprotein 17-related variable surface protein [Mycoplasma sp. 21DD0573]